MAGQVPNAMPSRRKRANLSFQLELVLFAEVYASFAHLACLLSNHILPRPAVVACLFTRSVLALHHSFSIALSTVRRPLPRLFDVGGTVITKHCIPAFALRMTTASVDSCIGSSETSTFLGNKTQFAEIRYASVIGFYQIIFRRSNFSCGLLLVRDLTSRPHCFFIRLTFNLLYTTAMLSDTCLSSSPTSTFRFIHRMLSRCTPDFDRAKLFLTLLGANDSGHCLRTRFGLVY